MGCHVYERFFLIFDHLNFKRAYFFHFSPILNYLKVNGYVYSFKHSIFRPHKERR
jgi:hypothetical protein